MPTIGESVRGALAAVRDRFQAGTELQRAEAASKRAQIAQGLVESPEGVSSVRTGAGVEQFRRAWGRGKRERDLEPMTLERAQQLAHYYDRTHPTALRAMDLVQDFVLGEGIEYQAEHERVQTFIDDYWSVNQMDRRIVPMFRSICKNGEGAYPVSVGVSRIARRSVIDPLAIEAVENEHGNPLEPVALHVVLEQRTLLPDRKDRVPIIRLDPLTAMPGSRRRYEYEASPAGIPAAHWFTLGKEECGSRGWPLFASGFDWCDVKRSALANFAHRSRLLNKVVWQVLLKGVQGEAFNQLADEIESEGVPGDESLRVVNEFMEWKPVTPQLAAAENDTLIRVLDRQLSLAFGIPPHWLSDGYETSMATADAMGDGPYRMFCRLQGFLLDVVREMIDFAIWLRAEAGHASGVPPDQLYAYTLTPHPLRESDRKVELEVLEVATRVLATALEAGFLTGEEAIRLWRDEARVARLSLAEDIPPELLEAIQGMAGGPAANGPGGDPAAIAENMRLTAAALRRLRGAPDLVEAA